MRMDWSTMLFWMTMPSWNFCAFFSLSFLSFDGFSFFSVAFLFVLLLDLDVCLSDLDLDLFLG